MGRTYRWSPHDDAPRDRDDEEQDMDMDAPAPPWRRLSPPCPDVPDAWLREDDTRDERP